ncbi:hypothetical protein [Streptomyces sp. MI02-7b]|uniref:hypothetical protein n=1 Tax=Streptomyces sp. MI02-7b TaxID=462941 RepID=UPI0029BBB0BB|nr:hypothetical protein [Streptomyces sp. MI02-7b]MDX3074578.1 hypothetical protein [Streptomyces sp. MI02-7b]
MPDARYRLHDGQLMQRLMKHPLPGGTRHTRRSLADATGLSYTKIHRLISEERPEVDEPHADAIARELQSARKALFSPSPSTFKNGNGGQQ